MHLIISLLCLSLLDVCRSDETLGKIIFANILFRHGDRTPIKLYATDPYNDEKLWPVPFGQLTNLGKHQHLLLGKWLRNRYNDLIPETYSLHDIYVRSTDVDRTLMSAQANLAGLYPPRGDQVWDIKDWMPIPVHTVPQEEDSLLAGKKYCEKYQYELHKLLNSSEIKSINEQNAELYNYLSDKTGQSISSIKEVKSIYTNLFIESLYNKTLPEWTKEVYPDKLKPLAVKAFTIPTYNKILQRLKSGNLLKEMVLHMEQKAKKALTPDRKLWIYSAHDETIANLLMTLDLFDYHIPPYTSTLLFELRVNQQNHHIVTISYKNSTEEPTLLTLPGCMIACPLNQFIELTKDIFPENWEQECSMDVETYEFNIANATVIVLEENEAKINSSDNIHNSYFDEFEDINNVNS